MAVRIQSLVQELVGKECWHCFLLPDSSVLSLALGNRLPNLSKRAVAYAPDDPRKFRPEFGLWVECAWRLDRGDSVVTVWTERGPVPDGPMLKGISQLYGNKVTSVAVCPPAWDLVVEFEGGFVLKVFVDTTELNEDQDAWTLFDGEQAVLTVGSKGRWIQGTVDNSSSSTRFPKR